MFVRSDGHTELARPGTYAIVLGAGIQPTRVLAFFIQSCSLSPLTPPDARYKTTPIIFVGPILCPRKSEVGGRSHDQPRHDFSACGRTVYRRTSDKSTKAALKIVKISKHDPITSPPKAALKIVKISKHDPITSPPDRWGITPPRIPRDVGHRFRERSKKWPDSPRNQWPRSVGTGGRLASESVAGLGRNTHVVVPTGFEPVFKP